MVLTLAKSGYTYYTQNAHGDVVNLTDVDGEVVKSYTYYAFGVEKNIDESDENAFRYCGEYFDTETGTIYLRARYYNPTTGRFITRDSYAGRRSDPLSLNRYTYCHNNPVVYVDPSGNFPWLLVAVVAVCAFSMTSCDTVKKAPIESSTTQADYTGTTTQVATSTSKTVQTTTTTTAIVKPKKETQLITKQQLSSVGYDIDGLRVSWGGMDWDSWSGISDQSVSDLNRVLNKYEINTTERIAHFIGQCSIESRCGSWITERGSEEYLKSKEYYPYYGAGYIQLTWESNYRDFAQAMGDENIMNGPQYVVDNYAWEAAGWFWSKNNMNEMIDSGASVYDITQVVRGYDDDTWMIREQAYNATKKALGN